jgi:hypothetical protein
MAQLYNELSSSIPTTSILDVEQIQKMDTKSPEFRELIVRLSQQANSHALAINNRDTGLYDTQEYVSGQSFFPNPNIAGSSGTQTPAQRPVYRKVINFGALPGSSATISVAHGITIPLSSSFTVTRIYGSASKMTNNLATMSFIPLPYADPSAAANSIALNMDGTNVNITTGTKDWSSWTSAYVVIEFLKN